MKLNEIQGNRKKKQKANATIEDGNVKKNLTDTAFGNF